MLNKNRYNQIKKARQEVVDNLSPEKKNDLGEIRLGVSQLMMERDKNLDQQEAQEVAERAINRYAKDILISNESGLNGGMEAVHGAEPADGEMLRLLKKDFNLSDRELLDKIHEIKDELGEMVASHDNWLIGTAVSHWKKKLDPDKLTKKILNLFDKADHATGEVVVETQEKKGVSSYVARRSRLTSDINRDLYSRRTLGKNETREYLFGARLVAQEIKKRILKETVGIDEDGKAVEPFLWLSVHGKANKKTADFAIANKITGGKAACDPVVARWLKDKLNQYLRENNVLNVKGDQAYADIEIEGDKYGGADALYVDRYGEDGIDGFGELFQTVQLEIDARMRKKSTEEISQALVYVLEEFKREFSDKETYDKKISQERTQEDKERLEGAYAFGAMTDDRLESGQVGVSKILRDVLGVSFGDALEIDGKEFEVHQASKDLLSERQTLFFSESDKLSQEVKVRANK